MPKAEAMSTRPGWNYETPTCLYQLWPPGASHIERTQWMAAWTERRELEGIDYLDDDFDDGWRPDGEVGYGDRPAEAMRCFPATDESDAARVALLAASREARRSPA